LYLWLQPTSEPRRGSCGPGGNSSWSARERPGTPLAMRGAPVDIAHTATLAGAGRGSGTAEARIGGAHPVTRSSEGTGSGGKGTKAAAAAQVRPAAGVVAATAAAVAAKTAAGAGAAAETAAAAGRAAAQRAGAAAAGPRVARHSVPSRRWGLPRSKRSWIWIRSSGGSE
jgi:hypothetical protein